MGLPSRYISCSAVEQNQGNGIDIDLVPSSTLEIEMIYQGTGWIFGARNTDSTSSNGQTTFYEAGAYNDSYVGYYNTRINLGEIDASFRSHIHIIVGEADINIGNSFLYTKTLSTTAFTGTRNMYLFAMNSGGTIKKGDWGLFIYACRIKDNGVVVRELTPAYDTQNNQYGMYDLANDVFYTSANYSNLDFVASYLVTIGTSTGGGGIIETINAGNVKQQYGGSSYSQSDSERNPIKIVAIADKGYIFSRWEDSNGNFVSAEKEFNYVPSADITLIPVFAKKTKKDFRIGYRTLGIQYGGQLNPSMQNDFYAEIESASINFDLTQRTTSTIKLKDVPSTYQVNMPLCVISPKGRVVYAGVIQSINGRELVCREPLALYDEEFMVHSFSALKSSTNIDLAPRTIIYQLARYMMSSIPIDGYPYLSDHTYRKYNQIDRDIDKTFRLNYIDNIYIPSSDPGGTNIINLEDFAFDLFNNYGIVARPYLQEKNGGHVVSVMFEYYKNYRNVTIGTNNEVITNVTITKEDMENTLLYIFNSSGSSVRAVYAVNNDGSFVAYDGSEAAAQDLIANNLLKRKMIMTGDAIKYVVAQYLSNAQFNHNISFNISLEEGTYGLDELIMGSPCDFYDGSNVYKSMITGLNYEIGENTDEILFGKVVLGKVRTTLTSKLAKGKK